MKRTTPWATLLLVPLLASCSFTVEQASAPSSVDSSAPAPTSEATPALLGGAISVPGYALGEFPPVPLFVMPDLSMLDSSMAGFSVKVRDSFPSVPGISVRPATCDSAGRIQADSGTLQFYGDGSGTYTGPDGTRHNYGDGSGDYTINGKTVHVYGDGSGDYTDGKTTIHAYGDGSGDYTDGKTTIHLYGDGSGDYADGTVTIHNYGDGSGDYTDGTVTIHNYGDGSGDYTDGTVTIHNYGDRSGDYTDGMTTIHDYGDGSAGNTVSQKASMHPQDGSGTAGHLSLPRIERVPPLGHFPNMGTIKPIKSCGTRIVIDDSVLFDFNKDTLRPEAQTTLKSLGGVLTNLSVRRAIISGHTDSIGSDSYNQDLSERRANSVRDALVSLGVSANLETHGYGETQPIAPNELDGHDNPAGRQQNRRVEIFIPEGA